MKKYQKLRIISFSLIFIAVLIFFGLNYAQPGKKGKGKPAPPPLELGVINLATQDFSDTLRVWTRPEGLSNYDTGFVEQWSKEKCDYNSLEFGDANNDGSNDLVVSGYIEKKRKKEVVYYSHFEVYENGSTDEPSFISEEIPSGRWYWRNEARVADLDGDGKNEVILKTSSMIAIYQLGEDWEVTTLYEDDNTMDYVYLDFAVDNLDDDSHLEIVVSRYGGVLRIFDFFKTTDNGGWEFEIMNTDPVYVPGYGNQYTATLGDIKIVNLFSKDIPDYPEILGESHEFGPELGQTPPYLHVWTADGTGIYSHSHSQALERVDPHPENRYYFRFDAGDLDRDGTVEVILGTHWLYPIDEFIVWQWSTEIDEFEEIISMLSDAEARTVTVSNTDLDPAAYLEVAISGRAYFEISFKDFYVAIFNWDGASLIPSWSEKGTYQTVKHHTIGGYPK